MRIFAIIAAIGALIPGLVDATCVAVSSDKIVAADLVEVVPLFLVLPPDAQVGFSPLPGTERVFTGHELALLLRHYGVARETTSSLPSVCVQRASHPIAKEDLKNALVAALGMPDAELELISFSSQPLPPGRLDFRRSGLSRPPQQKPDLPVIWRGRLVYDSQHSASVWAKVTILVDRPLFLATTDIATGALIHSAQVKETRERQFPFAGPALASSAEILAKVARRRIANGQKILPSMLDQQKDVSQGDRVHVRVLDGLAYLSFDAIAMSSGQKGDAILVHKSDGGRSFRAVIEQKGEVLVQSSPEK